MRTIQTDILVVGAGPAGLVASALLAREGVQALTVAKHPGTAIAPRAHITNQRTVEVFRDLGFEKQISKRALPQHLMGKQVTATSFAGREICRMMAWGAGNDRNWEYRAASPSEMCNIAQHQMEPIILDAARKFGADIRFNNEVLKISQDADDATAIVRVRHTGEEYEVRARYVLGCDGAQTIVGSSGDFEFEGSPPIGAATTVWLEADLAKYVRHRSGALFFVSTPGGRDVLSIWTCVEPWNEWSTIFFRPGLETGDLSEKAIMESVQEAIGDMTIPVKIKNISPWKINQTYAKNYQDDRFFLAGDAAHRHPPAGGLGACTSIQDAYNIAWKIVLVLTGRATPSLLETYSQERQPIGKQIVERAILSVMESVPFSQAIGFMPGQSHEEAIAVLDDLHGPKGEERRRRLFEARDLTNYQYNALGVEVGYRYERGAIADDGMDFPPYERDPQLHYKATTHPGARVPHVWLQRGTQDISTLDLCAYNRFTLLIGVDGAEWADAALEATRETGVSVRPVVVDLGQVNNDVLGEWMRVREVSSSGCILVRPDRVVAWRSADKVEDPCAVLTNVMRQILHADVAAPVCA